MWKKEAARRALRDIQAKSLSRQIDMPRSNLYKKIEKYGLNRDE